MILGIDVSTSITGFCVMSYDDEILYQNAVDMRNDNKYKNIYEKAGEIELELNNIREKFNIDFVGLEQKLSNFSSKNGKEGGGTTIQTLLKLAEFNGMVSLIAHKIFGMFPEHIHPSSARKQAGITIRRGMKAKEQVMKYLLDKRSEFVVEYTRNGNIRPKYYDIADAIVIASAFLNQKRKE